ncbi:MAG: hypothetical protein HGGPFJEG_01424 [Ignavibacteria bacterium]|nr:hypothetical protein [Ignavibacteria bacterium]
MKSLQTVFPRVLSLFLIFLTNAGIGIASNEFTSVFNLSDYTPPGKSTSAVSVTYYQVPKQLHFFARDEEDSAEVTFRGKINSNGYDSMYLDMFKNNVYIKRKVFKLIYSGGNAPFTLSHKIHAELSEYKFKLHILDQGNVTQLMVVDSIICGDAFVISGQSNSDRTNLQATYKNEFCRTFGVQTIDFNYTPYIASDTAFSLSVACAPNFYNESYSNVGVWGLRLQKFIKENFGIPTCIINGGLGGSAIEVNLRNNGNPMDLSTAYGKLLYRVTKAGLNDGIKAIFWYQGESNGTATWVNYSANFNTLYNSWKQNYPNFKRIFLFQTRPCCTEPLSSELREVQRNIPSSYSDIEILATNGILNFEGWHFEYAGYNSIADMVYVPVCQKFYEISDTAHSKPPNIRAAYYTTPVKNQIALLFENSVVQKWPNDTLGQSMKNYFYLNGSYGAVTSGSVSADTLFLNLNGTSSANKITYLPSNFNNNNSFIYQGPFLKNPRNLGILSFCNYPISNYKPVTIDIKLALDGSFNASTNRMNSNEKITVLLRTNYYPYYIVDSAKSIVDSVSLTGRFIFKNVPDGNYYIVIKGINVLETWCKSPGIYLNEGSTNFYDFTSSASQAYGNNMKRKGTKYCIYNSDVNQDGSIDGMDNLKINNDANLMITGKVISDINSDYFVDGIDMNISEFNSSYYIIMITP